MKDAVSQVADIEWIDIFNEYDKERFSYEEIKTLNKALKVNKSPVQFIYNDTNNH